MGAVALALPLPSLSPPLPFLSCLLRPEEMEQAGGGPLSSHPLPSLNQERPFHLLARPGKMVVLQGKCLELLPGARTLRPPAKFPSRHSEPLPTAFPAIVLERTEPPSLALPLFLSLMSHCPATPQRGYISLWSHSVPDCPGWQQVESLCLFPVDLIFTEVQRRTTADRDHTASKRENSNHLYPAFRAPVLSIALNGSV